MLSAYAMPSANNTTLEKGKCGFNGVGVNVALNVDSHAVPDGLVSAIFSDLTGSTPVGLVIISEKHINIIGDILANIFFKGSRRDIVGMKEAKIAATLTDADYDFFVIPAMFLALAAILAAHERLIHFDFAAEFGFIALYHGSADAVAEVPRGLVSFDSERALNLAGTHSFLGFTQQHGSEEPSRKRQVGIVKDGVYGNAELVFA
jgi:hypothetical protein